MSNLKASELRIGNLVLLNNPKARPNEVGKIAKVLAIDGEKAFDEWKEAATISPIDNKYGDSYGQFLTFLNPIPLTEEWLLRLGFDGKELSVQPNVFVYHNGSVYVRGMSGAVHPRDIPFVHTLQNFIFALTGEELTIKEANNE